MAAITGALAHARPSYATQRYQQITTLADRGVADPVTPAIRLLPGVELSV
jgi:hypothetical protein